MPWRLITESGEQRFESEIPTPDEAGQPNKSPAEVAAICLEGFIDSERATRCPADKLPFAIRLEEID